MLKFVVADSKGLSEKIFDTFAQCRNNNRLVWVVHKDGREFVPEGEALLGDSYMVIKTNDSKGKKTRIIPFGEINEIYFDTD